MAKIRKGFTLVELLCVVVIIGILAMLLFPNVQVALQKSRQKSTMKDIASISTAIAFHVADKGIYLAQDGTYDASGTFYKALCPLHIMVLPLSDHWGNRFRVWCGSAATQYGISDPEPDDFLVASFGRDDTQDGFTFNPESPEDGAYTVTSMDDFDKDLVMWNGYWIRRPADAQKSGGGGSSPPSRRP